MNVLPCDVENGVAVFAGRPIDSANAAVYRGNGKMLELGVRPEFVGLAPDGIPVDIVKVLDAGRYRSSSRAPPAAPSSSGARGRDRAAGQRLCPLRPRSHANLSRRLDGEVRP